MSSAPVKTVSGVGVVAGSLKFPSESPFKRPAGVAFDGEGSKIATSTGSLTTEIGDSEKDEMIGQGTLTIRDVPFNPTQFQGGTF